MKINLNQSTLEKRLKIYKNALFVYRFCLYFPFLRIFIPINHGFCNYFGWNIELEIQLPELYNVRPKHFDDALFDYWFKPGVLLPRIKCLKKAIELTYKRIENRDLSVN